VNEISIERLQAYIPRALDFVGRYDSVLHLGSEFRAAGDDRTALLTLAGRLQSRISEIEAYEDVEGPTF
jgi:hypothetical protein